jgi:hypothetical protein
MHPGRCEMCSVDMHLCNSQGAGHFYYHSCSGKDCRYAYVLGMHASLECTCQPARLVAVVLVIGIGALVLWMLSWVMHPVVYLPHYAIQQDQFSTCHLMWNSSRNPGGSSPSSRQHRLVQSEASGQSTHVWYNYTFVQCSGYSRSFHHWQRRVTGQMSGQGDWGAENGLVIVAAVHDMHKGHTVK